MSQSTKPILDPHYQQTKLPGILIPNGFDMETFNDALTYEPRPDDVFISTFPKCGTTFTQQIVYLIYHKGVPPPNADTFFKSCPFLDARGKQGAIDMPRPNAIKTHLRYGAAPYASSTEAKYIYMLRNPKDCVVSFYHHALGHAKRRNELGPDFHLDGICEFFFNLFCQGQVEFGCYFENLKAWYAHKDDPNVLFLHFEEVVDNPEPEVMKIAKFLGQEYEDMLRNDNKMLQDVIRYSSFDFMKVQTNEYMSRGIDEKSKHVRRGKIGGWRDELTPEQSQRIDQLIEKKLKDVCPDIISLWNKYNCI